MDSGTANGTTNRSERNTKGNGGVREWRHDYRDLGYDN